MSVQKLFRTQIGGFHKDDVNNYIKNTDVKHAEELAQLREQIQSLEKKVSEAEAEKAQLSESLSSLQDRFTLSESEKNAALLSLADGEERLGAMQTELDDTRRSMAFYKSESETQMKVMANQKADITAKDETISALEDTVALLRSQLAEQTSALEQMVADNGILEKQAADLREQMQSSVRFSENADDKDSPAYKIGMYDKISSQLGDILINANRNADDILANARTEADRLIAEIAMECEQKRTDCDAAVSRIKSETEEEASYIRERLSSTANELLSAVSHELHGSIENCVREINSGFTDMQYEFKSLLSKITGRSDEMNDRVNYYQACVSDSIEAKLCAMDEKYGIQKMNADEGDHA